MHPRPIQNLIAKFAAFPTVGRRSAARFVYYLIKAKESDVEELIQAIQEVRKSIRLCSFCFNPYEAEERTLCKICADNSRDVSLLCVVEKESDLEQIEKTGQYHGLYFILGGTAGMLKAQDLERIRIQELKDRIQDSSQYRQRSEPFSEVILALDPTAEGETTSLYLERILKPLSLKVTRLGRGLPIGGEIEYADEETVRSSLENRR